MNAIQEHLLKATQLKGAHPMGRIDVQPHEYDAWRERKRRTERNPSRAERNEPTPQPTTDEQGRKHLPIDEV